MEKLQLLTQLIIKRPVAAILTMLTAPAGGWLSWLIAFAEKTMPLMQWGTFLLTGIASAIGIGVSLMVWRRERRLARAAQTTPNTTTYSE